MGVSAFGKASTPTKVCRSSAEVRFTAWGVILHQLGSLSLEFSLHTHSQCPCAALLEQIDGSQLDWELLEVVYQGKERSWRKESMSRQLTNGIWEDTPVPPYKLPAHTERQPQNMAQESMTLHPFFGEYLNSTSHISASYSGLSLTLLHAKRANPSNSGHASQSKPSLGCPALKITDFSVLSSLVLPWFPGRMILKII